MRQIAIIPARGGSKRLPRKNILPINGQPMITYPIAAALQSRLFDEVIVSTEDSEIAEVAVQAGASVIERPVALAQDRSTVVQVCSHILSLPQYQDVDNFCCIYATAILLKVKNLKESRALLSSEVDFVMGVTQYNYHPVQALCDQEGYLSFMWPSYKGLQSQFYPELVVDTGTLYWAKTVEFLKVQSFYGPRLKGYAFNNDETVDINTLIDYERAKSLLSDNIGLECSKQ